MPSPSRESSSVDDEPEGSSEILQRVPREQGFAVRTAMEGTEALAEAKPLDLKAILLDVMMPNLGGLEILERIAANQSGRRRHPR